MSDELAARRQAVRERLFAKQCAETIAELERQAQANDVARQILASRRKHPSTVRPYDQEAEQD
jgi:hypothetical protein